MTDSILVNTPEEAARVEKLKKMEARQDRAYGGIPGQRCGG